MDSKKVYERLVIATDWLVHCEGLRPSFARIGDSDLANARATVRDRCDSACPRALTVLTR
jgi:hypothetical protein